MSQSHRFLDEALKEAREIAKRTDLNDEERTDLAKRVEKIEGMKVAIKQDQAIADALKDLSPAETEEVVRKGGLGLGAAFVASDEFQRAKSLGFRGSSQAWEYKAEPTIIGETTALANLVVAQRVNQIEPLAVYPATVADLIPVIPTSSNMVTYYTQSTETSSIATVAEDAEKPNFTLAGAQVSDEVEVLAGMAAVTRQTLEDAPFMAGFINTRMAQSLRTVEEEQILEGDGTTPNLASFDFRTTSTLSQGADTVLDAIAKAADKCYTAGGYPADAVVIKPSDWQPIMLSKDANDRYYGTGPFASAVGDSVWGLRVVKANTLTAGTAFVGAFAAASFLARNGGVTLRTSDSHASNFKFNRVAILIEERVALGIPAPLAICQLTLA